VSSPHHGSPRFQPALALAALAALAACSANTAGLSPLDWQKVQGPQHDFAVLDVGSPGKFDELSSFTSTAVPNGAETWLYYGGSDAENVTTSCPGIRNTHWRIGLAKSTDGVRFTRDPGDEFADGSVLGLGTTGASDVAGVVAGEPFDSYLVYRPFVLKDGALFRMWYNGADKPFRCPGNADDRRIGYAESSDGVHWTKHYDGAGPGGSVLPLGGPGSFDEQQVGYVWVLKDGAEYKLYYSAADTQAIWRVGLAVSTDAIHWEKRPGKLVSGAVLDLGPPGSLDAACAYQPSVVKEQDGLWRMWYRACAVPAPVFGGPSGGSIAYAESNDGITWVKVPQPADAGAALTKGPAGWFDSGGLTTPSVILTPTEWEMYYAGFDTTGTYRIGLARAPR
jgi:hypothetical protein